MQSASYDGEERAAPAGRPLTGRAVLIWLLAFFAVVAGANAIMVRAAISTFGGVETQNAYKAGLAFNTELAAAHRQEALHWTVTGAVKRIADGLARVDVQVSSEKFLPGDLTAEVTLSHPTDARYDRKVEVVRNAAGAFAGNVEAPSGQWELTIDLMSGGNRLFRSRNRIILR